MSWDAVGLVRSLQHQETAAAPVHSDLVRKQDPDASGSYTLSRTVRELDRGVDGRSCITLLTDSRRATSHRAAGGTGRDHGVAGPSTAAGSSDCRAPGDSVRGGRARRTRGRRGLTRFTVLVLSHLASRRVQIAGIGVADRLGVIPRDVARPPRQIAERRCVLPVLYSIFAPGAANIGRASACRTQSRLVTQAP